MRAFSIVLNNTDIDINANIIDHLPEGSVAYVFAKDIDASLQSDKVTYVKMPEELDNIPKQKNYVIKYFKDNHTDIDFVHLIEESTVILKNPLMFLDDIENMMDVFSLSDWFSTICDRMNYVYSKYNPRIKIAIDKPEYMKFGLQSLLFTSHANTQWLAFNMKKIDDKYNYFCEEFTIPMFFIIEHLANRRNTAVGTAIDFMNMYPTVLTEEGTFRRISNYKDADTSNELMKKEDDIFKSKKIDFAPTNSIDLVLKNVYDILKSK